LNTNIHFGSYLAHFFLKRKMFQTKVVGELKAHILRSVTFFLSEYRVVYEVMWKKYSRIGEAIDDNMAHALFTLGTKGHKHTLTEYVIPIALPPQQLLHERV